MSLFSSPEKSIPALLEACFEANWLAAIVVRHDSASKLLEHEANALANDALDFAITAPEAPKEFKAEIRQDRELLLAFLERVLKSSASQPLPVVVSNLSDLKWPTEAWVFFGVGLIALVVIMIRQKLAASEEFISIARQFGTEPWAGRLLRSGPERAQWSIIRAWPRAELSPTERKAAVAALGMVKEGQLVKFGVGVPFDASEMECEGTQYSYVASTISNGLKWKGKLLVRAQVQTATSDYITLQGLPDSRLTRWLREKFDMHTTGHGLQFNRSTLYPIKSRDAQECDHWLRALCAASPESTLIPFDPQPGQPLNEQTTESEVRSMAPQHEIVAEVRHCGVRRKDGEVLLRALVSTKQSEGGRSRF